MRTATVPTAAQGGTYHAGDIRAGDIRLGWQPPG
jgi:hypothetical protein